MRERERKVRDGRKRREKGAETGIGRWDRRTEYQCANGGETTGRLGWEVSQRRDGKERRQERAPRGKAWQAWGLRDREG